MFGAGPAPKARAAGDLAAEDVRGLREQLSAVLARLDALAVKQPVRGAAWGICVLSLRSVG